MRDLIKRCLLYGTLAISIAFGTGSYLNSRNKLEYLNHITNRNHLSTRLKITQNNFERGLENISYRLQKLAEEKKRQRDDFRRKVDEINKEYIRRFEEEMRELQEKLKPRPLGPIA